VSQAGKERGEEESRCRLEQKNGNRNGGEQGGIGRAPHLTGGVVRLLCRAGFSR